MRQANFDKKIRYMKTTLFTLSFTMLSVLVSGQDKAAPEIKSGKIYFEEKIKLDIKLEGDAAQMSDMFPKERKSEKILSFTNEATLFETGKDISEDMTQPQGEGVHIKMVTAGDSKIYTDLKNKKITEQRDFMNRMFLVEQEMPESDWKITGNQKIILGYPCMEAVKQDTAGAKTIVWFAPSLNIQGGPATFSNLPGMVLEVDVKDGTHTYIAKSIVPVEQGELRIKKPSDGKKVTEAEYHKIVADKMKEMGMENDNGGDGAHVKIIIKN
jgi:GLPGLI family protein